MAQGTSDPIGVFLEMMSAERGAAANTIEAYGADLGDYSQFLQATDRQVIDAKGSDIAAYLEDLHRRGLSAASSARKLSTIRQFHRHLCTDGWRHDDPTRIIQSPRTGRPLPRVLSLEEVDRLFGTAQEELAQAVGKTKKGRAMRLYLMLEMLYATGMRVSELICLPRQAVMRDAGYLTIAGKGGRERIVPLNRRAREALAVYVEETTKGRFLFPASGRDGFVSRQVLARELKALARKGRHRRLQGFPARAAPRFCFAFTGRGGRSSGGANAPGARRRFYNPDIYPRARRAFAPTG